MIHASDILKGVMLQSETLSTFCKAAYVLQLLTRRVFLGMAFVLREPHAHWHVIDKQFDAKKQNNEFFTRSQ